MLASRWAKLAAAAAAALLMTIALAACGSSDGGDGDYEIVMIPGTAGDEFYYTIAEAAKRAAKAEGVDLDVQFPNKFDPQVQTEIVNAALVRRPDAILIAPTDAKAMAGPLRRAADQGIKVILFDTTLEETDFVTAQVLIDDVEAGRQIGRTLSGLVDDRGKLLFISVAPGISTTDRWIRGFREATADKPGLDVLDIQYSDNEETKAASIVRATLQRDPDLAGAFLGNLVSERGAMSALHGADEVGDIRTVAFDGTPPEIEDLRAGDLDAIVSTPASKYGETAVRLAVRALSGEQVPRSEVLDTCVLTRANVDAAENADCIYQPLR